MSSPDWLDSSERDRRREFERAAKVLHDDVGQQLTAVGLHIDLVELDYPAVAPALAAIRPKLEAAFASIRALSADLNPDLVARVGFAGALEALARRAQCTLDIQAVPRFTPAQQRALYRIAECAVDNARTHGMASEIVIRLSSQPAPGLRISDNGAGFDVGSAAHGYGFLLSSHLAALNQLRLSIRSAPGQGTMLEILSDMGANGNAV